MLVISSRKSGRITQSKSGINWLVPPPKAPIFVVVGWKWKLHLFLRRRTIGTDEMVAMHSSKQVSNKMWKINDCERQWNEVFIRIYTGIHYVIEKFFAQFNDCPLFIVQLIHNSLSPMATVPIWNGTRKKTEAPSSMTSTMSTDSHKIATFYWKWQKEHIKIEDTNGNTHTKTKQLWISNAMTKSTQLY